MKELLKLQDVKKHFHLRGKNVLKAVDGVSFSVGEAEVFGLVGESGCGKSTLAKLILKLIEPAGGQIYFEGQDVIKARGPVLSKIRQGLQIIFQDPLASLNPRKTVLQAVGEGLVVNRIVKRREVKDRVAQLLGKVGLDTDALDRYPHEFSGGQRQRICIARALAVDPRLIIADEPLSALDVSIQAQIINLLEYLQEDSGLAYLLVSHNLLVIEHFSDMVAVMYLGKIVEMSKTAELFKDPLHPYTEALLSAVPKPEVGKKEKRIVLEGDVPSPVNIPPGCPFHPRCHRRFDLCDKEPPAFKEAKKDRWVSCHLRE
ncbi:MAG TPA: ATP-binding cassette domain-containing protein [Nitrospirae bacterium]|nr:ATP-binding cassette domain-containing protein [Nitrospirota bacterium]HDL20070.1 ATP-binding cassette domain-containing protein [Nitrospirota bacterium]HDZ00295.1 ATP-binding cassette domain-containing protein [Nitrospirota bacterium]